MPAPVLGCPTTGAGTALRTDSCSVPDAVVLADTAVLSVQREQRVELVGVSTKDGSVNWHRTAPVASRYDCTPRLERLWCVTNAVEVGVVVTQDDGGGSSSMTIQTKRSERFTGSTLTEFDPTTGAVRHTTLIANSSDGVDIAGFESDALYVVVGTTDNDRSRRQVLRYSAEGALAWSRRTYFVSGLSSPPAGAASFAPVRVVEKDAKGYVTSVEVAGRQGVFDAATGRPVTADTGHVVAVSRDAVVTQRGNGALNVSGTGVPDSTVLGLAADDRSPAQPVLTAVQGDGFVGAGGSGGPARSPVVLRSLPDPQRSEVSLRPQEIPIAFCSGALITVLPSPSGGGELGGVDPRTGNSIWPSPRTGVFYQQPRCAGSTIVFTGDSEVVGIDLGSGAEKWNVAVPAAAATLGRGTGDPATGLVVGPRNVASGTRSFAVTFVR